MRSVMKRRALLLCACVVSTGCLGSFSQLHDSETPLEPNEAEVRIERAFSALGIPLLERNMDGRVRSGKFDPYLAFGARWPDRMSCNHLLGAGTDRDVRPIRLEVIASIRSARGTRVQIESYGAARKADGEEISCRLSEEALQVLRQSVQRGF